jgi:hypothetical protein
MRSYIMHALAGVLIVGISGGIGLAKAASPGSYRLVLSGSRANRMAMNASVLVEPQERGVPRGDYQLTCRDIRTDGYVLKANCQKVDGGWRSTSLDTRNCGSQIINDDGYLRCTQGGGVYGRPPGGGWQGGIPPGDYKLTCRDIRNDGNVLKANCQKVDGGWRSTSLDTRSCRNQIVNEDGRLRCAAGGGHGYGPGGWQGGIPPGDYRLTCENIRVNGQRLDASCQKTDGSWRNTSLENFSRCGDRISNVDGRLRCGQ